MSKLTFRREIAQFPPVRLFVSDVDRTLLTHAHELLPEVAAGARRLGDAGLPLVLASARSPTGLDRVHGPVGASEVAIGFNGGWIGRLASRETIAETRIARELALEVMAEARGMGAHPIWYLLDHCVTCRDDEAVARTRTDVTGDRLEVIGAPSDAPDAPFKLLVRFGEDDPRLAGLVARYAGRLEISRSGPELVEIVPTGVRKDRSAARVAADLGLEAGAVAVAGDSDNDLGMLEWAGLAITVANAAPHVQAAADVVAPSCEDAGMAAAFGWVAEMLRRS